jgi:hypothetical protein
MYAKVEDEKNERVNFHWKNIANEMAAQLSRELNHRGIVDPSRIHSIIDIMGGGDHGKRAFISMLEDSLAFSTDVANRQAQ